MQKIRRSAQRQWVVMLLCGLLLTFGFSVSARLMDNAKHDFSGRLIDSDHHHHGWFSDVVPVAVDQDHPGHGPLHHYHPEGSSAAIVVDQAPLAAPLIDARMLRPRSQQPIPDGTHTGFERPPKTLLI